MSNPETGFGHDLHRDFVTSMSQIGFIAYLSIAGSHAKDRYRALFMPAELYEERLKEHNIDAFKAWLAEREAASSDDGEFTISDDGEFTFVAAEELPDEVFVADERYVTGDVAWEVLANAAEIATKIADDAAPDKYNALDDATLFS